MVGGRCPGNQLWRIKVAAVEAVEAVHSLIDAAFVARNYRLADTYATQFFEVGGRSRFLNARFLHACDTIAKVIKKRALPVIESFDTWLNSRVARCCVILRMLLMELEQVSR